MDVMIAIRSNFFYTRTVPCELWFLDRAKPESHRDKVLMLDARNVFRKVSRKICDFSPEQQQNLLAVVWLHRGETRRYLELVSRYLGDVADEALYCFEWESEEGETFRPVQDYLEALDALRAQLAPFLETRPKAGPYAEPLAELENERRGFEAEAERFRSRAGKAGSQWERTPYTGAALGKLVERFAPLAESSRSLARQADQLHRFAVRLIETCEREGDIKSNGAWNARDIKRARKTVDEARLELTYQDESEPVHSWGQLRKVDYFWRQARWLTERFPDAELQDVAGLVKLVDRAEIEANDWSLTPGRYVGVAPAEEDENFDFGNAMREIHAELDELNAEAVTLAAKIKKNFESLGI